MRTLFIKVILLAVCSNLHAHFETTRRQPHYREQLPMAESSHAHSLDKIRLKHLHTDAQSAINSALEQGKHNLYEATEDLTQDLIHKGLRSLMNTTYAIGRNIHHKITGTSSDDSNSHSTPVISHPAEDTWELPAPDHAPTPKRIKRS